jgi:hypothetical protein
VRRGELVEAGGQGAFAGALAPAAGQGLEGRLDPEHPVAIRNVLVDLVHLFHDDHRGRGCLSLGKMVLRPWAHKRVLLLKP